MALRWLNPCRLIGKNAQSVLGLVCLLAWAIPVASWAQGSLFDDLKSMAEQVVRDKIQSAPAAIRTPPSKQQSSPAPITTSANARSSTADRIDYDKINDFSGQINPTVFKNETVEMRQSATGNVLILHPFPAAPAFIEKTVSVDSADASLEFSVRGHPWGDFMARVVAVSQSGQQSVLYEKTIIGSRGWYAESVDLGRYQGQSVTLRFEVRATGWHFEYAGLDYFFVQGDGGQARGLSSTDLTVISHPSDAVGVNDLSSVASQMALEITKRSAAAGITEVKSRIIADLIVILAKKLPPEVAKRMALNPRGVIRWAAQITDKELAKGFAKVDPMGFALGVAADALVENAREVLPHSTTYENILLELLVFEIRESTVANAFLLGSPHEAIAAQSIVTVTTMLEATQAAWDVSDAWLRRPQREAKAAIEAEFLLLRKTFKAETDPTRKKQKLVSLDRFLADRGTQIFERVPDPDLQRRNYICAFARAYSLQWDCSVSSNQDTTLLSETKAVTVASVAKTGQEIRTGSGALFRIVACGGLYQGVAVVPPKSLDLRTSTPSNTYSDAEASGGIFPFVREAIEFFHSACPQTPGYTIRPPARVWLFLDRLPPAGGVDLHDTARYVLVNTMSNPWSVRNGPSDFAKNEDAQRRRQVAAQEKQAQVVAQREQENAKRAAFLTQHRAVEIPKMGILRSNPFSLEGKTIAIPVDFYRMTSPTVGRFEVLTYSLEDQGGQIVVSDIPKGTFLQPTRAFLAAKVVGLSQGGEPHLKYVGVAICSNPNTSCP